MFKRRDKEHWQEGVLLKTVKSSLEASILESKLKAEGIPCVLRYAGAGGMVEIIAGSNHVFPIDIYVLEETLEKAKEVIIPVEISEDEDYEFIEENEE